MTTSSPSPTRSDRRRSAAAAVLAAGLAILAGASLAAAATVPLPVDAVLAGPLQTSVVVDLSASSRPGARTVQVTTDGVSRAGALVPLMSTGLAVTIVVDTSTADAATLPAWLSAAARFVLEAPPGTRSTVLGDSAPASVIAPPQPDPTVVVAALTGVQPHGSRDTAAALALAANQFPEVPAGRKVAVLYTGAADAGGPSAAALADQFKAAGVILVVATTADASPYWTSAAEPTGGFFAPAGNPAVVPALDQIATTLGGRYLVQFPTPAHRPATVPIQVTTPDLQLAGTVPIPAAPAATKSGHPRTNLIAVSVAGVIVLLALVAAGFLVRRNRRRHRPPPIVIAHGRATVPTVAPPTDQ